MFTTRTIKPGGLKEVYKKNFPELRGKSIENCKMKIFKLAVGNRNRSPGANNPWQTQFAIFILQFSIFNALALDLSPFPTQTQIPIVL
jgi:hypothetical protein